MAKEKKEWGVELGCVVCRHLNLKRWGTCKAFPKKIPHPILSGAFDHRKSFPGDHEIRFEERLKKVD